VLTENLIFKVGLCLAKVSYVILFVNEAHIAHI